MEWTAEAIIELPLRDAAKLLGNTPQAVAKAYKKLAMAWHPDHNNNPVAASVFAHINDLRAATKNPALAKGAKTRVFTFADANPLRMTFLMQRATEFGLIFVGTKTIAYLIHPDFNDLAEHAAKQAFAFTDAAMKNQMTPLLPHLERHVNTLEGHLFIYRRTEDQILLADLIDHLGGDIEPAAAAWMTSGLANLCAYLGHRKVSHGAIGPDCVLVSPKYHSMALTGPMLFATELGKRPRALPDRTLGVAPIMAVSGQGSSEATDLELMRLTIREAFKDPGGSTLIHKSRIPHAMAMWLVTPPAKNATSDYLGWERTRDSAFGARRFMDFNIPISAIYSA